MDTLQFKSSQAIRERLDMLEDAEVASSEDFEIWHSDVMGEESEIIRWAEIEKLGLRYVNTGEIDEIELEEDAIKNEMAAIEYERFLR